MKKLFNLLASSGLAIVVLTGGTIYYVLLIGWSIASPKAVVENIAGTLPFIILYVVFIINTLLCCVKWLPAWKQTQAGIANLCLHLGIITIIIGAFLSWQYSFLGDAIVTEGQTFWGEKKEYFAISKSNKNSNMLPLVSLKVDKIEPELWNKELLFTKLKAHINYPADTCEQNAWIEINTPAKINESYVSLNGFGYSPKYVLYDNKNKILQYGFVTLFIFPPGSQDSFKLENFPHKVYVKFYPDFGGIKNGKPVVSSFSLKNPLYFIKIIRGKLIVFEGMVKPEDKIKFEGLTLTLPETRYWAQFKIVQDSGYTLLITGFIVCFIGIGWRLVYNYF